MKKSLILLTIILLSLSARADGQSGYYLHFRITTPDRQDIGGYLFVSHYCLDIDSLSNTEHLKRAFVCDGHYDETEQSLTYFQNRMIYQYQVPPRDPDFPLEEQPAHQYYLLNEKTIPIPLENIEWIEIFELISDVSYVFISSELQLSDFSWMRQEPIESMEFYAHVCYHQLFIHAGSEKVENVIKELEQKQEEIDKLRELYFESSNETIWDMLWDKDEELREILKKLKGEKVVAISSCADF